MSRTLLALAALGALGYAATRPRPTPTRKKSGNDGNGGKGKNNLVAGESLPDGQALRSQGYTHVVQILLNSDPPPDFLVMEDLKPIASENPDVYFAVKSLGYSTDFLYAALVRLSFIAQDGSMSELSTRQVVNEGNVPDAVASLIRNATP